jgi:hypothetical protein
MSSTRYCPILVRRKEKIGTESWLNERRVDLCLFCAKLV